MDKKTIRVVEKNGKFFGETYADGHSTEYGWLHDPTHAKDARGAKNPGDILWSGHYMQKELQTGKIVDVEVTWKVIN